MKIKLFKMNFKISRILGLCLLVFSNNIFSETSVSHNGGIYRAVNFCNGNEQGLAGQGILCYLNFSGEQFRGEKILLEPYNVFSSDLRLIGISSRLTAYGYIDSSSGNRKPQYSLSTIGIVGSLQYTDTSSILAYNPSNVGYYIVKNSEGEHWAVYLNYTPSSFRSTKKVLVWGDKNHPEHPWQACSPTDSFDRTTGCSNNEEEVIPPSSDASISQNTYLQGRLFSTIVMDRQPRCVLPPNENGSCAIRFKFVSANSSVEPFSYGKIKANRDFWVDGDGPIFGSFLSSEPTNIPGGSLVSAEYSLAKRGKMRDLSYTNTPIHSPRNQNSHDYFLSGYYAIKSPNGLYWSAYLYFASDSIGGKYLTWGKVDNEEHPWQICSQDDTFSREIGCDASGGGTVTPPPVTTTGGASIFDGAGSIIDANTDCYGCDKDTAVMHPHNNANSTVVFQWLHNPSRCDNLILTAVDESNQPLEPPLAVEIKSKGWNSQTIQSAYKTQISNTASQPLRLTKQDEWTTIAVTSSQPVDKKIWVTAACEAAGDRLPGLTRTTIEKTPVTLSGGANWMGTGSIISTARRSADGGAYGVVQDLAIGSDDSKAVTSLQWLSSEGCENLILEDGSTQEASRNVKVSMKLWSDAKFTQHEACNSLPCGISPNESYHFYVLKIESEARSLPNGIRARCLASRR